MVDKVFEALRLNERGQCPNCLRKPLPYERDGHWFCPRCCRDYRMDNGEQRGNWAWLSVAGGFIPRYSPDGNAGEYVNAKPTAAALRRRA